MKRSAPILLLATVALCACSTPEPAPPLHHGPGRMGAEGGPPHGAGAGRGCRPFFLSPSGEPFRGRPFGEAGADTPCPLGQWFARADADHDGGIDKAEFRADALRFFAMLDVNGDGVIDGAELRRYEREIAPEILRGRGEPGRAQAQAAWTLAALQTGMGGMGGMGGGGGGGMGGGGMGGGGRHSRGDQGPSPKGPDQASPSGPHDGLLDEPEPVAAADLNFDGRITRAEFATRADQRFARLDPEDTGALRLPKLAAMLRAAQSGEGRRRGAPA